MGSSSSSPVHTIFVENKRYEVGRMIGRGYCSKVFALIPLWDQDAKPLALKVFSKSQLLDRNLVDDVTRGLHLQIVALLARVPFVGKLRCSFQSSRHLFILLDFMPGGDLHYHLQNHAYLDKKRVLFYAANILICISYLHSIGIVHGDIKPSNILIDSTGL